MAVWKAADGQILPCEREGGNIHDPYDVTIGKNNDTPIDCQIMLPSDSKKIFAVKTFTD